MVTFNESEGKLGKMLVVFCNIMQDTPLGSDIVERIPTGDSIACCTMGEIRQWCVLTVVCFMR